MKTGIKRAFQQYAKCPTLKNYLPGKTSLVLICLFQLSFITTLKAQDTPVPVAPPEPGFHRAEFGFRFMPTVSNFEMKTYSDGTVKGQATFGYGIGGMLAFNFSNNLGIEADILYNKLSQKYKDRDLDRRIDIDYINVPLMFSVNTGKANPVNLNIVFGPQFGYNIGSKISKSGDADIDTITYVLALKHEDFGIAYGAGFEFMLNETRTIRMDMGFRSVYGMVNITKTGTNSEGGTTYFVEEARVRTKSIYMGISFLF